MRRSAAESQRLILDAAAQLLAEGGVEAVQVRAVARRVGMTDAGINHHFGTRDRLLEALLRHGGRQLRRSVQDVQSRWLDDEHGVRALVDALAGVYRQGYAELALALHVAGWRDHTTGLLDPVVDALHARGGRRRSKAELRLAVAALHQAIALDPLFGSAFRRSAGIPAHRADDPADQLAWWTTTLASLVDGPTSG